MAMPVALIAQPSQMTRRLPSRSDAPPAHAAAVAADTAAMMSSTRMALAASCSL